MTKKEGFKSALAVLSVGMVVAAFFGAGTYWACRIQPNAYWFLIVLALTPLWGRLFCECLCPLGVIQTVVNKLFHPKTHVRRVCTRLPEKPLQRIVRCVIALAAVAAIGFGYGALGWALTPYSILGKALVMFVPGLVLFALVVVLAALGKGRVWCNWICPIGTVLTYLAKIARCQHKVGPGCGNCRACFPKKETGNGERATGNEKSETGMTRREALQGVALLAAAQAAEKTTDGGFASVSLPGVPKRPAEVLPPGARDRALFNRLCVGCGLCVARCPGKCLAPSVKLSTFGQPEMDFRHGHCLTGCDYTCGKVCPAGAIVSLAGVPHKDVHVGHAIWKKDRCIRETDGVECTACVRKCPVKAIHLVEGFPVVDKGACIGCGACEHVCPSRPLPAIFVKGFDEQRVVRPVDASELVQEMLSRLNEGAAVVTAHGGRISSVESGRGVEPLLRLLDKGMLKRALVADKVVGRAAAAIDVVGGVAEVRAQLASLEAIDFLAAHGITCTAEKIVPKILNRSLQAGCPLDASVSDESDPAKMVEKLRAKLAGGVTSGK